MAVPTAPPIPAPISAPLPPAEAAPMTVPVAALSAAVAIFSPFWLSARIVPSSSLIRVFSAPGALSTAPGKSTV
jgi:hypothetical protein